MNAEYRWLSLTSLCRRRCRSAGIQASNFISKLVVYRNLHRNGYIERAVGNRKTSIDLLFYEFNYR